jgi:hypothetical protein
MFISRSKSAPQPISSSYNSHHDEQQLATIDNKALIPRAQSSQAITPFAPPYRRTRRAVIDRGDPFNLSTFFPSPFGRDREGERRDWHWLGDGDSEHEPAPTTNEVVGDDQVTGGIMFGTLEDDLAGESIKDEDKFGVLSLGESRIRRREQSHQTNSRISWPATDHQLGTLLVNGFRDIVGI